MPAGGMFLTKARMAVAVAALPGVPANECARAFDQILSDLCKFTPMPRHSRASARDGRLSRLLSGAFWFPFRESSTRFRESEEVCGGLTASFVLTFKYPPLQEPHRSRFEYISDNRPASVTIPANSYTIQSGTSL